MKKRLLTILITSLVMIGGMGGLLFRANSVKEKAQKQEQAILQEELDVNTQDKALEDVDKLELTTLYLSGKKKNVMTRKNQGLRQIYSVKHAARTEKLLTNVKEKGNYTEAAPLWAYNPYGTNPESLYLYFRTGGKLFCRYTISVDDDQIPDFTRTLDNGMEDNVTSEHEYQIIGLVPGKTNYITLKLYNRQGELDNTLYYKVDMPESYSGASTVLKQEDGKGGRSLQNGLYTVFQKMTGKHRQAILLYDNSGVLRAEFPTGIVGYNMEEIYDNQVFAVDNRTLVKVNSLGQTVGRLSILKHRIYGEFAYDGAGAVYILAQPLRSGKSLGHVVKVEINSGNVSDVLDLSDISSLQTLVKYADRGKSWKGSNHLGINSVQVTGTNQLLLGTAKYSALLKVSNIGSLMPRLDYMITDQKLWHISGKGKTKKRLRKKILTKAASDSASATPAASAQTLLGGTGSAEAFASQYGQNALVYEEGDGDGQYEVYFLDNHHGKGAADTTKSSWYYRYRVNEEEKTYTLTEKVRLKYNRIGGNVTPYSQSVLYCMTQKNTFGEYGRNGRMYRTFQADGKLCRVYKNDWKGFWFADVFSLTVQ